MDRKTGATVRRVAGAAVGAAVAGLVGVLVQLGGAGPAGATPRSPATAQSPATPHGPLAPPAPPAPAHARVVGSEPADDAIVTHPPAAVALDLDAKPATLEGDPLEVWGPDGTRVDTGRPRVSADGGRLTVDLRDGILPAGGYHVVYRVVSADTHLITGRLEFRSAAPGRPGRPGLTGSTTASGTAPASAGTASSTPPPTFGRAVVGRGQRAILSAAGAVAALGLLVPRRRRRRARHA